MVAFADKLAQTASRAAGSFDGAILRQAQFIRQIQTTHTPEGRSATQQALTAMRADPRSAVQALQRDKNALRRLMMTLKDDPELALELPGEVQRFLTSVIRRGGARAA